MPGDITLECGHRLCNDLRCLIAGDSMARRLEIFFNAFNPRSSISRFAFAFLLGASLLASVLASQAHPVSDYEIGIRTQEKVSQNESLAAAERAVKEADELVTQHKKELLPTAIAKLKEALSLLEASGEPQTRATVLNKIARCQYLMGDSPEALESYSRALAITRTANDIKMEAVTLTAIARIYWAKNENRQAVDSFEQALPKLKAVGDLRGELEALVSMGELYRNLGDEQKALSYDNQALPLSRTLNDVSHELKALNDIGLVYYVLGDNHIAIENWQQGLSLARANHDQTYEAGLLGHLGSAYDASGEHQKALECLDQAIVLARTMGNRYLEATTLQTIGRVYHSMGQYQKALEYLDPSLTLAQEINDVGVKARAHHNLGKAYAELRQYEKALDHLNQAIRLWKVKGDVVSEAASVHALARLERDRGNLALSLAENETSLNMIESLRSKAGRQELRASYLASVQKYFELRVDVLTRLHKLDQSKDYAAAALQTSERARARTLLETLAEAGVDIRQDVAPEILERERTIQQQLGAKAAEQASLFVTNSSKDRLAEIGKQIEEITTRYEEIEGEIRAASPRYAALMQPRPVSLTEIRQEVIDHQTVLLEYYLGDERSYLWAVTPDYIEGYELPKREELEKGARRVYDLLTARNRRVKFETTEERRARIERADADYPEVAAALSQVLLGPVAAQLTNKHLLVVGDGALQYIPFAALPAPNLKGRSDFESLGLNHEIVSVPSASTLALLRHELAGREPATKAVAVLADPVFDKDDERLRIALSHARAGKTDITKGASQSATTDARSEVERSARESGSEEGLRLGRLPFTRREADAITALVPTTMRKEALDFAASRSNATSADLSHYRIVHFATHGFLNSRHPELSGIVLSLLDEQGREQDGFLRAHEIYNLKLPADLVVLSGCRTGLGREIKGEGLVGLTRAFMHAGAARVLVSLWDVNDEATAELMTRFYKLMLGKSRLTPAAALKEAQASMSKQKRWQAPYYWSGFVLQGEPK